LSDALTVLVAVKVKETKNPQDVDQSGKDRVSVCIEERERRSLLNVRLS
jgi:hypothetical protein